MTNHSPNGRPFAQYTILGKLGRGGMGVVYRAHEQSLGRDVALKMLPAKFTSNPKVVERFLLEARTSAKLSHPNITPIYAVGEHEGTHYIAMEYVQGRTLFEYIREKGPLDVSEALRIVREAADALREAHRNGILHRDIKPGNIMLDQRKRVKVMDFGLARVSGDTATLTVDNAKLGTPAYMSPEQCEGKPLDVRTDIYSLGVTFYEMLTAELPFPGDDPRAIMFNIGRGTFPDIREKRTGLPNGAVQLLRNMTAADPVNRYESVRVLMEDLNRLIEDPTCDVPMPGAAAATSPPKEPAGMPTLLSPPSFPVIRRKSSRRLIALLTVLATVLFGVFANVLLVSIARTDARSPEGAPVAPIEGLVAYWPFDEGRGTQTLDAYGGHRGVLHSATWTRGVRGTGIEFQGGESSYVEVPHSAALSPRKTVTMTAWIKVHEAPRPFAGIIFKSAAEPITAYSDRVYTLWLHQRPGGQRGIQIESTPQGSSQHIPNSSTRGEVPLNEFVHIAGVIDTAAHEMAIYINGEKVSVHDYSGDAIRGGNGPLRLGGMFQIPTRHHSNYSSLYGILDEVRLYRRALTRQEIRRDMRQVHGP